MNQQYNHRDKTLYNLIKNARHLNFCNDALNYYEEICQKARQYQNIKSLKNQSLMMQE